MGIMGVSPAAPNTPRQRIDRAIERASQARPKLETSGALFSHARDKEAAAKRKEAALDLAMASRELAQIAVDLNPELKGAVDPSFVTDAG